MPYKQRFNHLGPLRRLVGGGLVLVLTGLGAQTALAEQDFSFRVERFEANPIIHREMHHMIGEVGENINGPSLIRVPEWIEDPLGAYYLYFAHHDGQFIRLAYADHLKGPWKIHEGGPQTVLKPRKDFEGAFEPVERSSFGSTYDFVHQLRDPAIYVEDGRLYLLYSAAGEWALAIAELQLETE
ncbi:MAG: hypothetical protein ACLFV4_03925 [Candidatus Hydrogenedentota bacterium]